MVAVRLIPYADKCVIYIAENGTWRQEDNEYIDKIKEYVKSLSKDALITLKEAWKREDVKSLFRGVMKYCSAKLDTRFEKLKKDIINSQQNQYIRSFIDYASIDVENIDGASGYGLSGTCSRYYKTIKGSAAPEKFLRHIKKVGSYYTALYDITACACKEKYKLQFLNMYVHKLNPITISQPIFSWKNIIQRYIPNHAKYEEFKSCLDDRATSERLSEIYGNVDRLDDENIKQHVYLHAEMNILANIIDQKYKGIAFIAVSKRCCYLCELYIKFARTKGYQIFTSGAHKKLYHKWILPNIMDTTFRTESLNYMIKNLNWIINEEIGKHVSIVERSDSEGESGNSGADSNNHEEADELMKAENPQYRT